MTNRGVLRKICLFPKQSPALVRVRIFQVRGSLSHTGAKETSNTADYSFGLSFFLFKCTNLIFAWSLPLRVGKEFDLDASRLMKNTYTERCGFA
jgi:hypothetical protein